jgi:cell division protein FtsB
MVKLKFVLMLLVLALIGFGGWGYTMYQHNILQNNYTVAESNRAKTAVEFEELLAENKRLTALVEADINERKAREAADEEKYKKMTRNTYKVIKEGDIPDMPLHGIFGD